MKKKRMRFFDLFVPNIYGGLTVLRKTRIAGVQFDPDVVIGKAVCFGGIDLTLFIGRDLQVEKKKDLYIITGIYS